MPTPLRLTLFASLLTVAAATSPATDARAMCAAPRYFADLVTPIDRPLPLNAPLLVTVASARSGALEVQRGQTVITPPSLALVQGETRHPLQSESIGPGLFVYRAESPLEPGEYQLEGFAEARTLTLASIALPSLTVPAVQRVRHEEHVREGREGGRSWRDRIELAAPAPAEIVALLFTFADSTARIDIGAAGDRRVVEEASGYARCGRPGPIDNDRISFPRARVSAVDRFGRVVVVGQDVAVEQVGALASSSSPSSSAGAEAPRCAAHPGHSALPLWPTALLAGLGALRVARRRR